MAALPHPLNPFGYKRSCALDEDGILAAIIERLDPPHYFVEFGAHCNQSNCLHLYRQGWNGLFMDASQQDKPIKQEWITPGNINELLDKYQVPNSFGVLSIDIDGQDILVWQAIKHAPPIVVIEYNPHLPADQIIFPVRNDAFRVTDRTYGCTLSALKQVGGEKGYTLVYANVDAFFVRTDCFDNPADFATVQCSYDGH
jgi:hypothetical protein